MDDEIQLISDGDGLAVIGDPATVDRFLASEGLPSEDLGLRRLGPALNAGAAVAQAGGEIAAHSGRWLKLTKESARAMDKYGLRENAKSGLRTGVLKGDKGQIKGFVEFVKRPGPRWGSPALLAGAAGIMAQLAMQQSMDVITDYLAAIDEKVDGVIRGQKDAVVSRMIGVGLVIDECMLIRAERGRVDDVIWSKVQTAPTTVAETQVYALRQLDALAQEVERATRIGDLAKAVQEAESKAPEWIAVLARSFQLQDAIAVLELDRVLDASPEELDGHRLGLKAARRARLDLIAQTTEHMMARMDAAVSTANTKVLTHPSKAPAVVHSGNRVSTAVLDFHERLGIEAARQSTEPRRWTDAAKEVRDKAIETGVTHVGTAKRLGNETLDRAKGTLSTRLNARPRREEAPVPRNTTGTPSETAEEAPDQSG